MEIPLARIRNRENGNGRISGIGRDGNGIGQIDVRLENRHVKWQINHEVARVIGGQTQIESKLAWIQRSQRPDFDDRRCAGRADRSE